MQTDIQSKTLDYPTPHFSVYKPDLLHRPWRNRPRSSKTQDEDRKYQLTFEEVRTYYGGDLLRVDPTASTLVQTIRNVRVPLAHVQRALRIVVPMLHAHETYQRSGHSINVGEFKLDSIDAEGTVRCGCHTFPRAEVLRFAASIASIESPIDSISPENEAPQGA